MSGGRRQAILFASTPPARGVRVLDHVRQRWPDHDWTVCVKAQERGWLPADCPVVPVPRGQPGITAMRRLRRGAFDLSIVCWTGEKGYARLKALHLLTPARERHIYNENIDSFELLRSEKEPTWLKHVRWRFGRHEAQSQGSLIGFVRWIYGVTLGPLLGGTFLLGMHALWLLGLGRRARASAGGDSAARAAPEPTWACSAENRERRSGGSLL